MSRRVVSFLRINLDGLGNRLSAWSWVPDWSGKRARRRASSPQLEPPIASGVLSHGTAMLELVVRVILVEQSVPARCLLGNFLSPKVLEVVRSIVCLTAYTIRALPIGGELAFVGVFGVSS
ncbi:hypothetical protein A2U01_0003137 [Trifolium medium]|uniref:Uncharacterized protein n=1 Tax=Trifolium medium TaxID=97028 RepID=A0A392M814_9FABA|nr:hypothetical protein [Trifolium medium]